MSDEDGGWTITLVDIVAVDGSSGKWNWNYEIRSPGGGFTGSNFVGFLLPDCCNPADLVIDEGGSEPDLSCADVGVGEQTIYFGRYNNQAFVCKGNPDSTGDWTIVANTPYKTRSTIIIKSGKTVLQFEMAVPGCPPALPPTEPLIGNRNFSECSNFGQDTIEPFVIDGDILPATADDVSFYVIRTDDRDGCVNEIWKCEGLDCPDCTTAGCDLSSKCEKITAEIPPPEVVTQTSFTRTCPDENISVTTGSPYYLYTVNSGGFTYRSCLDLGTYRWLPNLNCCLKKTPCP